MLYSMKNTLPLLKEVAEDIYLLSIPVPLMKQVNCYLFRGEKGFTVIDTGIYTQEGIDIWERSNGIRDYNRKGSADTFSS